MPTIDVIECGYDFCVYHYRDNKGRVTHYGREEIGREHHRLAVASGAASFDQPPTVKTGRWQVVDFAEVEVLGGSSL